MRLAPMTAIVLGITLAAVFAFYRFLPDQPLAVALAGGLGATALAQLQKLFSREEGDK